MLEQVNSPIDLRKLNPSDLPTICKEIREFIIGSLANNPGHLGSSLGTVELATALHYVFKTPDDKLIWDVGHQAYAHKILTGRKKRFHTIRTYKGISGFPKMSESEYDAFGTGHSSTSISAALGMAVASSLQGNTKRQHIAVIGDGSMTAGMAFEALNHAGVANANILVILNDNGIAIDKNVGALSNYLTEITTSPAYNRLKNRVWNLLGGNTNRYQTHKNFVKKVLYATKSTLLNRSNLFESLNFRYFGPINGHDVENLVQVLTDLKKISGPKLLHIITKKGKGLEKAEENPVKYHAPGLFNPDTGEIIHPEKEKNVPPKFQDVFGHTLIELAEKNKQIVGITPAMPSGCSLNLMMGKMPERAFDVGIAEQHAVTFAAGLAAQGMIPFCNIYSSFMQRAYDQVIHDVALQKLPVVFCLDRGGLVGEDGTTHQGVFDLAFFRPIPNLTICSPLNEEELRNMMYTSQLEGAGTYVIRYPRGRGNMIHWKTHFKKLESGKGRQIRNGKDIAILSLGYIGNMALQASDILSALGIEIAVYDMRFLKPLDTELLHEVFNTYKKIITLEDGVLKGGLGDAVLEFMNENRYNIHVKTLGIPDRFIEHGCLNDLYRECEIDVDTIIRTVKAMSAHNA